jgi:hypothetical protein
MTKINVLIDGIFFPVTACLEYLVRAFKKRDDCDVLTVGPYTGLNIPWGSSAGMVMPERYDFPPDIKLPFNGLYTRAPTKYIESQLKDFVPDLVLDVNAGFCLEGIPTHGVWATFLTDPHVLRSWYNIVKANYNFVFCPQIPYANENEIYLPFAADSEWCTPIETEKLMDVTIIGNHYENRINLMKTEQIKGRRTRFDIGVAKADMQLAYSQSIIGVNWSSMQDLTARVFEVSCLGIVPVINLVPDLNKLGFIDGKHFLGFTSQMEAELKINLALNDPALAAEIGKTARQKILTDHHTWDDRAQTILEVVGLL